MDRGERKWKGAVDSSLTVMATRVVASTCRDFKAQIRHAFAYSATYRGISWSALKLRVALRDSVLGRLTEVREGPLMDVPGGSVAFGWLAGLARKPFSVSYTAFSESFFRKNIVSSFRDAVSSPIRAAGVFLLISGSVNTLLSILSAPKMGAVGVILRAVWIGFGLIGIFCPTVYRPVLRDSFLLRFIKKCF